LNERCRPEVRSHDRWVVNKLRALSSWYTKAMDGGSELRSSLNSTETVAGLRGLIMTHFGDEAEKSI
jgi:hypothetical protein